MRLVKIRWTIRDISAMMRCAQWLHRQGAKTVPEYDGETLFWRVIFPVDSLAGRV